MEMTGSGLSAADVMALTKDGDGFGFGGIGGFVLLFIFLLAISGNGFFGGSTANGLALADIQNSLYNQSQDSNARALMQGQCNITDSILNASYNNLLASKDISNQISNQTLALTSTMAQNTNAILTQMNTNVINELRDKVDILRNENSNLKQTAQITENILGNLATTAPKPPCYYGYGCGCNSLY